jgi:hypothetical protein
VGQWQRLGAVGAFNWQFTGCPHCSGGLAAIRGTQGVVLHSVVWTGQENSAGLYYLSSGDHGRSWSKPRRIGGGLSREADIAAASPSRLTVVFSERSAEGIGIRFIRSTDRRRTWSNPGPLTTPGVDADDPRILSTALGLWAFWTENRPGGTKVWAMGFPERS